MPQLYSYSRVGSYSTCPAQYAHRYVTKTPSPSPQGVELFMGSRFHDAMEFLYGELPHRVPPLKDVLDHFEQAWEKGWRELLEKQMQMRYETPVRINKEGEGIQDYHHRARGYVEHYYGKYAPFDQDKTLAVEKRVVFDLDPAKKYRMQGFIDRLARTPDGTLWVHDYKTGSRKLSEEDARNEDQLALYQIGLFQDPHFRNDRIRLAWHFVAFEDDTVVSERAEKELDFLRKKYIARITEIEKAKDFPTRTSALCGWCDFLSLCADGKAEVERRNRKKAVSAQDSGLPAGAPPTAAPAPPMQAAETLPEPAPPTSTPKRRKARSEPSRDQLPLF